jgi:hypothetical protein
MRTGRAGGEEEGKKQKTKNGNLYSSRNKDKNVWRFFLSLGKRKIHKVYTNCKSGLN